MAMLSIPMVSSILVERHDWRTERNAERFERFTQPVRCPDVASVLNSPSHIM